MKEEKCKDCIIVFARSTLDIGEVNWRQRGHELNIEDQKEKEIRNIRKKRETWTRIRRSKDLVIFVYLWGIEDPPRNKRKGGKGGIVGEEKSVWSKSQFWNSINININYTSPSIFKQPCNSCLLPVNSNRQTSQLFFKFFHGPNNSQSLWHIINSEMIETNPSLFDEFLGLLLYTVLDFFPFRKVRFTNSLAFESFQQEGRRRRLVHELH